MIKTLRTQHRNIIQMSFNGFRNHEIAERLSMTEPTISQIINSPLGQAYLGGLNDRAKENTLDVRKQLISMNSAALSTFERILNPASPKVPYNVQYNTAKDILDRNGFKPTDKVNIDLTLQTKTDEEIEAEITALTNSIEAAKHLDKVIPSNQSETIEESSESFNSTPSITSPGNSSEDSSILSTIVPAATIPPK